MAATRETKEARVAKLNAVQLERKRQCLIKVDEALERMQREGLKINFNTVAKEANVSVSYLYKYPEVKCKVAEIRNKQLSMPKPELAQSSTAKSQQKMIARLKDRIKRQGDEIDKLKEVNQVLAGRVYKVSELEALVERQEKRIKDLEARLREFGSPVPPSTNNPK